MQRLCLLALVFSCFVLSHAAPAETWYVRADGGTRYSANVPLGQCDGLADAAYPGVGVNQHCAFGDYRSLWDDRSYGNSAWVIAGGDTVIVDNTQPWRVGFDGDGSTTDPWCYGGDGPYSCSNPMIPAGTSSHHTRILGRNYASCSYNTAANSAGNMSQLFGGHGVYTPLNLQGARYVDVACLEITRHSNCIESGSPAYPAKCNTGVPLDDYDSDGIEESNTTANVTLTDLWIHGHTGRGIKGPIGGPITATRVDIAYNGLAGWDFDDGNATGFGPGAVWNFNDSIIEWSGCNQEYPIVDAHPAASCYGQSNQGYGDGVGSAPGQELDVYMNHDIFRYNTQDGEDFGHVDGGSHTFSVLNSLSYGNNGGQFKWGWGFTNIVFENNIAIANCERMSASIPGAPSTFNANLADFCRSGDALSFNFQQGTNALFANNTIVSYAPTTFDYKCVPISSQGQSNCSAAVFTLTNNNIRAYADLSLLGYNGDGGPGSYCGEDCNETANPIGTINRDHNMYYGFPACPANQLSDGANAGSSTNESCVDPAFLGEPALFISEATLDNFDANLSEGSMAIAAGVPVAGLSTDYNGTPYADPPSIGALQYVSGLVVPTLSFAAIANKTYGAAVFAVSATSVSSGLVSYAVTSGPATLSGNLVTLTGTGTVVLSATQSATSGYTGATASISFTVAAAAPTLSFAGIGNQTFGSSPITVSASSASSGLVTYTVVSGPAMIAGDVLTLTGAGTVMLSAAQAAATNYLAASATISFSVAPALPTLRFTAVASQTFGASPLIVRASSASDGAVTYTVSSGPATISGSLLTLTGAGTVALLATQAASTNYLAATATGSFTVAAALPTLRFAPISNQTFGNPSIILNATSISPGAVTYAVVSGPAIITGNVLTIAGAGGVMLSATQAASTNYLAATAATSFNVAQAVPLLSFAPIPNQSLGSAPLVVSASSASSGPVTYTVSSGPATISADAVTFTAPGTVTLAASQAASGNYAAATASTSFQVSPAFLSLSFATIRGQTYGNAPVTLSVIPASGGSVTYTVISGPAKISGSTALLTGAGVVVLSADQAANGIYAEATATTSFSVAPAVPILTFATIPSQSYGVAPFTVSASSASTGAITYSVVSGPASMSGDEITLSGAGSVTLSATQQATSNYTTAAAAATFAVTPALFTLTTSGGQTASEQTATTTPGGAAIYKFLLTPSAGGTFQSGITLSAAGLPPGATASFSPTAIASGSHATTVTLSIQTSSQTAADNVPFRGRPLAPLSLSLLLVPFIGGNRAGRRLLPDPHSLTVLAFIVLGAAMSLGGCGASAAQQHQQQVQAPQTYTVSVTGTDQIGGWSTTTSVSLVIQ